MPAPTSYSRTRWPCRLWASIDVDTDAGLRAEAAAEGRPLAEIARAALTEGLQVLKRRRRERRRKPRRRPRPNRRQGGQDGAV